jgi:MoxR-like ATPase
VLSHRVIPNYNAAGEGVSAADIVTYLLQTVKEPSYEGAAA